MRVANAWHSGRHRTFILWRVRRCRVGQMRQEGEHLAEVSVRFDSTAATSSGNPDSNPVAPTILFRGQIFKDAEDRQRLQISDRRSALLQTIGCTAARLARPREESDRFGKGSLQCERI